MASAIQSAVSSIQSALGTPTQKVLLLGSGFVAKPCLDYLAREGIAITVGMHTAPLSHIRIDLGTDCSGTDCS
jgi:hypothetical protein